MQGEDEAEAHEAIEKAASSEKLSEEVGVSSGRGREDAHGEAGVHALQVGADGGIPEKQRPDIRSFRTSKKKVET